MNNKFQNRRKFHRINFDGQAHVEFIDENYDCCQIKNISLTGMFIAGNFAQNLPDDCIISFVQGENGEKTFLQASGKIVWGNEEGVGLKFTAMKSDHYQLFVTTLINNAELPVMILSQLPEKCPFEILSI